MNTPLTPLQLMVAKYYEGGEFDHVETTDEVRDCGDTLFTFCMLEAGDMSGPYDLCHALQKAIDQLHTLADKLERP